LDVEVHVLDAPVRGKGDGGDPDVVSRAQIPRVLLAARRASRRPVEYRVDDLPLRLILVPLESGVRVHVEVADVVRAVRGDAVAVAGRVERVTDGAADRLLDI